MQMHTNPVHETAMICTVFIEDAHPHNQHFSKRNVAESHRKQPNRGPGQFQVT